MREFANEDVEKKFSTYPDDMSKKLLRLRELIYEVAADEKSVGEIEETLKWNEPSYLTKNGSTIRIDWKASEPEKYSIYFNCNTKLVPTFRELFSDRFSFEGNRAIQFNRNDTIDVEALKYCILLSLTYHRRKHLPMLDD